MKTTKPLRLETLIVWHGTKRHCNVVLIHSKILNENRLYFEWVTEDESPFRKTMLKHGQYIQTDSFKNGIAQLRNLASFARSQKMPYSIVTGSQVDRTEVEEIPSWFRKPCHPRKAKYNGFLKAYFAGKKLNLAGIPLSK